MVDRCDVDDMGMIERKSDERCYLASDVDKVLKPLIDLWEIWKLKDDPPLGQMIAGYREFYDAVKKVMDELAKTT